MSSESDSAASTFVSSVDETERLRQLSLICPVVSLILRTWNKTTEMCLNVSTGEHLNLIAADQASTGDNPERRGDNEGDEEVVLGTGEVKPEGDEVLVVWVVEALVGVLAGIVPPVPPVLYEEGGALKLQGVHTHLSVHIQLRIIQSFLILNRVICSCFSRILRS